MSHDEHDEYRHERNDRLLYTPQVEYYKKAHAANGNRELVWEHPRRQEAEERVRAACDRKRDGEKIVDQERAA